MARLFFSTQDGTTKGRSSYLFDSEILAKKKCAEQNDRAESLNLKVRYKTGSCDESDVPENCLKEIKRA